MKKRVLVLGCTGSIGTSTLKIIKEFPDLFEVAGLTAHTNADKLSEIAREFNCSKTFLTGSGKKSVTSFDFPELADFISSCGATIAVNGIAGSAGLLPSVYVLENGIDLALANKETVVMAWDLIKNLAAKHNAKILPVDSEHSAVFTLLEHYGKKALDSIVLTASGGPFRLFSKEQLKEVKVEDALKHPTWNMGAKITIDSATLANKGLEVIEATRLFDVPPSKVFVSVHCQSLVHSLIRTKDGALYAQISKPDMRHPILQAMTWPDFYENSLEELDLSAFAPDSPLTMTFAKADTDKFPMLALAYQAADSKPSATICYNAANETAVSAFASHKIGFYDISNLTEKVLSNHHGFIPSSFEAVFDCDKEAHIYSQELLQ